MSRTLLWPQPAEDGKKPASLIADTTTANAQVRSLSAQAGPKMRSKSLLRCAWTAGPSS